MSRARPPRSTAVALALLAMAIAAQAAPLESTRALAAGLRRAGRAEASLSWTVDGPPGHAPRSLSGTLSLEPPALARLDVPATGERITLRADGGEWLQPSLKQFVHLEPRHSVAALRWWRLLAGAGGASEHKVGARHFRLIVAPTPGSETDSADVWLDARGLPARLVLADGMGAGLGYRLAGWRFRPAKGAGAFRLAAPPGFETVELP